MANLGNFGKPVLDGYQRRTDERHECNIACRISTKDGECNCTITNISLKGAGLKIDVTNRLRVGSTVNFTSGPLKGVSGAIRWASPPRNGLEFHDRPGLRATIMAAFQTLG